jgi:GSH-dependent disulfide-bond oxidoreductase
VIDLYSCPTPNGRKVHIMLEECGLAYTAHAINIMTGDQFSPEFLAISPNNKIPAIIDQDGPGGKPLALFESAAILFYLAEKTGQFLPDEPTARYRCLQWMFWQMGGVGPAMGQAFHFGYYAIHREARDRLQYGIDRFTNESHRLLRVLEKQVSATDYVLGADYSIADMCIWPWVERSKDIVFTLDDYPGVARWLHQIALRPAVQRGMQLLDPQPYDPKFTQEQWDNLYGTEQFSAR